jgi:hypothetical protein
MTEADMARERFRGFVELSGIDRPYISKAEERRLLEQGISQFELEPYEARGIVLDVAQERDFRLERDIDRRMLPILARFGGRRKKIGRRKFNHAASLYNTLAGGVLTDEEAKVRVKQVMEANQFKPKRGGITYTRRWYKGIGEGKKDAKLPALLSRDI